MRTCYGIAKEENPITSITVNLCKSDKETIDNLSDW